MYQWYILFGLDQNNLIYPQIAKEVGNFNEQNILNLIKNISFEVS